MVHRGLVPACVRAGFCQIPWAEQHDVRLFNLHILKLVGNVGRFLLEPLVMIVNRDRKHLFRIFLADDMLVEFSKNRSWGGDVLGGFFDRFFPLGWALTAFFFENIGTNVDAFVANIHAGTSDEFFDL